MSFAAAQYAISGLYGDTGKVLNVHVSTSSSACSDLRMSTVYKGELDLDFDLGVASGSGSSTTIAPPSAPGMFTVTSLSSSSPPPMSAFGGSAVYDASCNATYHDFTSGAVTLTQVSSAGASGSFDVTLDSGDHITGTFDAPTCRWTNAKLTKEGGVVRSDGGGSFCR